MKKLFRNSSGVECIFTDDGITFCSKQNQAFYPYECIDDIKMSLMGVLQVGSRRMVCSFAVNRKDRADVKEMIRYTRSRMLSSPEGEPQVFDLSGRNEKDFVSPDLPAEEQLKQYKAMFIQGAISKEEYDIRKRQLRGN